MTATPIRPDHPAIDLTTSAGRRRRDVMARCSSALPRSPRSLVTVLIIVTLVYDAEEFIRQLADSEDGLGALNSIGWFPRRGLYDIGTLVVGTLIVTGIAMLVAVPLGLGAAIYLSEYADPRVRRIAQADHRGPGRHPQRRARLLRHLAGSTPNRRAALFTDAQGSSPCWPPASASAS